MHENKVAGGYKRKEIQKGEKLIFGKKMHAEGFCIYVGDPIHGLF